MLNEEVFLHTHIPLMLKPSGNHIESEGVVSPQ